MWPLVLLLGLVGNYLRGRKTVWHALPFILVAGWLQGGPPVAVAAGLGFWVWQTYPWGHLTGLGRWMPPRPEAAVSKAFKRIMGGSVHGAFALGHMLFIAPACLALWLATGSGLPLVLPVAFGLATLAAYEAFWRWFAPRQGEAVYVLPEALTGLAWGFLLLAA